MELINVDFLKEIIDKKDINLLLKEIKVKKYISLTEYAKMITEMTELVFDNGVYLPYFYSFSFDYYFLKYYTNIDCSDIDAIFKLTQLFGDFNNLLYEEYLDDNTLFIRNQAKEDYDKYIEFKKNLICSSSSWDNVGDLISELLVNFNEFENKLNSENVSLKDLLTAFSSKPNEEAITKAVLDIQKNKIKNDKKTDIPIEKVK